MRSESWTFNLRSMEWTPGPSLQIGRRSHACGVIKDSTIPDRKMAVAAAGFNIYEYGMPITSVELLVIGDNIWTAGPEAPIYVTAGASATTQDQKRLIIAGGFNRFNGYIEGDNENALKGEESNVVMQFQCWNKNCEWSRIDGMVLSSRVHDNVAMILPTLTLGSMAGSFYDNYLDSQCIFNQLVAGM